MSVYDKLFKTADEQKYFCIALPVAVECVFMSFLASADLIMVGSLGAAIGTVTGTLFTLCATVYVMNYNKYFSQGGSFIPDRKYLKEFLPIFGSMISEQGFERLGMVLFTRMAAGLGTVPFAVHSICMSVVDYYWDFATGLVCAGILRGSGKTAVVALYSFVSIAVLRPLLTALFLYVAGLGLLGAWIALFLDQSIRAGCATFLVRRLQPHIGHHMEELGKAA